MFIKRKASKWLEAGLLTSEQAARIVEFEKNRGSNYFTRGLYALGAFSILVGVLSIVAANWQDIPAEAKLSVHLLVNAVVAGSIPFFDRRGKRLSAELAVLGLTGLTLTLIALISQVFHLDGPMASALLLWMGISTPFVLVYGQTRVSLLPWIIGFVASLFAGLDAYLLEELDPSGQLVAMVAVAGFLPLAFLQCSALLPEGKRPVLSNLLSMTGVLFAIAIPTVASGWWYEYSPRDDIDSLATQLLALGALGLAGLAVLFVRLSSNVRLLLAGGLIVEALPLVFTGFESGVFSAFFFVLFWMFLAFLANRIRSHLLVLLAVVVIAIRIYVVYLEVFGSLLETGFGLVLSGVLLLVMVWVVCKVGKSMSGRGKEGEAS
ncbi:DUF2157 domain-containing protein [Kiloniella sp. b19]|uniref:DUF2157 domain-containing protein n=1 Tax=Kiloniella sp. GXU_MW_B19 TaxID=3141326 RepID=UPI0031D00DDA